MRTENLRPVSVSDQGRMGTSVVIAAMLVASAVAYVLLALQPGLIKSVSSVWGSAIAPGGGPTWAVPAMAAGIAIAAASLAMLVLSAFVRGVQRAPYLWLSPVLVGFSTLVLARLKVELPFYGVPLQLFALLAGLLLLGGGALVQIRGVACTLSGLLMLLLPTATFIAGHAVRLGDIQAVWTNLNTASGLFLFVLALTSTGVGIVAWVTRPAHGGPMMRAREWEQHREQLAHALERARVSELLQAQAERRAEVAEYGLRVRGGQIAAAPYRADSTDAFLALARAQGGRMLVPFICGLFLVGSALAAYFGVYRPLTRRLAAQQTFASEATKEHAEEIEALRKHFEAERAGLLVAVAVEREKSNSAQQAVEQARDQATPAEDRAAPAAEQSKAQPTHHGAVTGKAIPARMAAAKRAPHPVTAPTSQPGENAKESDVSRGLKEAVDDDPIGGLDGM
jgi:hypothetical protein